jgi:hypothetical protein
MQENLVTIAVFHSQPEFLLARTRLESADIECFAYDENMLRIGGWHSHTRRNQAAGERIGSAGRPCHSASHGTAG